MSVMFVSSAVKKLTGHTSRYFFRPARVRNLSSELNTSARSSDWKLRHRHTFFCCFSVSSMIPMYSSGESRDSASLFNISPSSGLKNGDPGDERSSRCWVSSWKPRRTVLGFMAPMPATLTSCSTPLRTLSARVSSTKAFTLRWSMSASQSWDFSASGSVAACCREPRVTWPIRDENLGHVTRCGVLIGYLAQHVQAALLHVVHEVDQRARGPRVPDQQQHLGPPELHVGLSGIQQQ